MRPIDIDDINDHYEAQEISYFFRKVVQVEKAREAAKKAAEKRWRENHPRTKLSGFLKWLVHKIELPD